MRIRHLLASLTVLAAFAAPSAAQTQPCGASPTEAALVACEQARAGGAEALRDPSVIARFLRAVAASLNEASFPGGPFGVLVKTSGHNCGGYSCDIICVGNGPSQKQWDVLVDAGGRSEPTWAGPLSEIAVRPCEIVAAAPAPEPVPDPRSDPKPKPKPEPIAPDVRLLFEELVWRIDTLSEQIWLLRERQATNEQLLHLVADVQRLEVAIKTGTPAAVTFPDYTGRVFGSPVTLRPVKR